MTTALHPTSRKSIFSIWSSAAQSHRSQPDASTQELFILLYGMLFTNIQLDDFIPSEELRAVYHFVKGTPDCLFSFEANLSPSTTTLHPLLMSRESILSIWPSAAQSHHSQPDASAQELFVLLYGMLCTNIQLDDLIPMPARFLLGAAREGLVRIVTKCSPFIYHEDVREDRQVDVDDESSRVLFALPHVSLALSLAAYVFNVVIRSP